MRELMKDVSDFVVLFCGVATLLILFVMWVGLCLLPVFVGMWLEEFVGSGIGIGCMLVMYCVYYVLAKRMGWVEKYMGVWDV
tara:strand:- start:1889 stop:2134 length:246 start_codon:yes stop_codon:yes gene_type:complete